MKPTTYEVVTTQPIEVLSVDTLKTGPKRGITFVLPAGTHEISISKKGETGVIGGGIIGVFENSGDSKTRVFAFVNYLLELNKRAKEEGGSPFTKGSIQPIVELMRNELEKVDRTSEVPTSVQRRLAEATSVGTCKVRMG